MATSSQCIPLPCATWGQADPALPLVTDPGMDPTHGCGTGHVGGSRCQIPAPSWLASTTSKQGERREARAGEGAGVAQPNLPNQEVGEAAG